MRETRPKNLNLFTIRFPLPAIISILHRISGVFLFLLIPFMLWTLQLSLSYDGYDTLQNYLSGFCAKFIFWTVLAGLAFHLVAGIRHLLSDIHIGTGRESGKKTALLVLVVSIILVILAGVWLW